MDMRPTLTSTPTSTYAQFLEQLSDEEFWKLAVETVRPVAPASIALASSDDYLQCVLEHGRCLLPLVILREIVSPPPHFSHFPAAPSWMVGIGAWRGETIPIVDLDAYLLKCEVGSLDAYCNGILLVAQYDALTLGFFVSAAELATSIEVEQIVPFARVADQYTYERKDVVLGVRIDKEEHGMGELVLDLPLIFADIVQIIKNDRLV